MSLSNDQMLREIYRDMGVLKEALYAIKGMLEKHEKALYGNGNPELSLTTQMDRVQQRERAREKGWWIIVTCTIGLLAKAAWEALRLEHH